MATNPTYRLRLQHPDTGEDYCLTSAGEVKKEYTIYFLKDGVDGWDDLTLQYTREQVYKGLFQAFGTELRFTGDGGKILKHLFLKKGKAAKCAVYMEVKNHTTLLYEHIATCGISFRSARLERDFIGVELVQGGLAEIIKANEDVEYVVGITGNNRVPVSVGEMRLQGGATWQTIFPSSASTLLAGNINTLLWDSEHVGINNPITPEEDTDLRKPFFVANQALYNVRFKAYVNFFFEPDINANNYDIRLQVLDGANNATADIVTHIGDSNNQVISISIDETIPYIPQGHKLSLTIHNLLSNNPNDTAWGKGHIIEVTYDYFSSPFQTAGLRPIHVLTDILTQMTGGKTAVNIFAPILSNANYPYQKGSRPYNNVYLSGDSIRGVSTSPYAYPALKVKFKDIWKDLCNRYELGMTIDGNTVTIKPLKEFFSVSQICGSIGEVVLEDVQRAPEFEFKTIKVGYPDSTDDLAGIGLYGKQDYNTEQLYNIPVTDADDELDLTSPFHASPYTIYYTWANYRLNPDKDGKTDNEVFVMEVAQQKTLFTYKPYMPAGNVQGVLDGNKAYNVVIAPKYNLLRNGNLLATALYGLEQEQIKFQKTEKNAAMVSNFSGVGRVAETEDVAVNGVGNKMFLPYHITIKCALPHDIGALLRYNPYGYLPFTYKGRAYKLYPCEIGTKPGKRQAETVKGYLSADADLEGLL